MSNSVSMDDTITYLNELIQLDRPAMEALFEYRVPGSSVGMLSVLNGLFASSDTGRITLCWHGNSLRVKRILLLDEGVDPNCGRSKMEGLKHYGVREPAAGWLADRNDLIFYTTNRKLAWAQAAHLWSRRGYSKLWHVVCIEEWVDEQA